jgi:hypothetical protein
LAVSDFRLRARLGFTIPSFFPRPARHYPRFRIWRPSSKRQRDSNPPDLGAAQHTLRPDPPPGRLRRHFPLTVIGDASSTSFPRRTPRASPVDTSSFVPCRRGYPAGESRRVRLVSSGPCCLRTLSTVSATGIACNEATSTFTARCHLVLCQYSISSTLSEGSAVLLSRHGASQTTRPESFSLGRTSTDWRMCPSLDTAIRQRRR